jgi:hypothetical protein
MAYGVDFLNDGTPTADSELGAGNSASKAFDNSIATYWLSDDSAFPHWVKYDLGFGIIKKARKLRMYPESPQARAFTLEGSNDDIDWTELLSEEAANVSEWQEWEFDNTVPYRYYKITVTSNYSEDTYAGILELELMEAIASSTKFNRRFN